MTAGMTLAELVEYVRKSGVGLMHISGEDENGGYLFAVAIAVDPQEAKDLVAFVDSYGEADYGEEVDE